MRKRWHHAGFSATHTEWLAIADDLERKGEARLAKAIRAGCQRHHYMTYGLPLHLRFADGSIAKLEAYCQPAIRYGTLHKAEAPSDNVHGHAPASERQPET